MFLATEKFLSLMLKQRLYHMLSVGLHALNIIFWFIRIIEATACAPFSESASSTTILYF
jgi:hypothetical protein